MGHYEVQGIACLRDLRGTLTPLHAFIGPNDSGKSALLRALRTALHLAAGTFYTAPDSGLIEPFDPGPLVKGASVRLRIQGPEELDYCFAVEENGELHEQSHVDRHSVRDTRRPWCLPYVQRQPPALSFPDSPAIIGGLAVRSRRGSSLSWASREVRSSAATASSAGSAATSSATRTLRQW